MSEQILEDLVKPRTETTSQQHDDNAISASIGRYKHPNSLFITLSGTTFCLIR